MKNWQKNRNYKRVKDKDGNVVANIISVYGQDVKVSDEVFTAYSQMDRQERYAEELLMAEREISWEYTREEGIHIETLENAEPSAEEICIKHENVKMRAEQVKHLPIVLARLSNDEQRLIDALFFRGLGVREYAREIGVPRSETSRDMAKSPYKRKCQEKQYIPLESKHPLRFNRKRMFYRINKFSCYAILNCSSCIHPV